MQQPSPQQLSSRSPYLRQPAVLVSTDSHSMWRGFESSLGSRSQPERGITTSSVRACSALSTMAILMESCEDRFHSVPAGAHTKIAVRPLGVLNPSWCPPHPPNHPVPSPLPVMTSVRSMSCALRSRRTRAGTPSQFLMAILLSWSLPKEMFFSAPQAP